MQQDAKQGPAPFGTVLGVAPGGVLVYSSDYATVDRHAMADRQSFRHFVDDVYMGYKWQCVELARRFLYVNYGLVFGDVAMAYEIFALRSLRSVRDGAMHPLRSFRNGSKRRPEPHCLLIWNDDGEFEHTGHVAVITEVTDHWVRVVEQNVGHHVWGAAQPFSRQLTAQVDPDGSYRITCSFPDSTILGWVIQTDEDQHAEAPVAIEPDLLDLHIAQVPSTERSTQPWLDESQPDEALYVQQMQGHRLVKNPDDQLKYFCMSQTAQAALRRATQEVHALFMQATEVVLRDEGHLSRFGLPRMLWPLLRKSWDEHRRQLITGRFDFVMSPRGLKVFEYNCDSAGCYLEGGKLQGKWASHVGCSEGSDAGQDLFPRLVAAWTRSGVHDLVHVLYDSPLDEQYHALYMETALRQAGLATKRVCGVDGLRWDRDGRVCDADGVPIRRVWKTWAWSTAIGQLQPEDADWINPSQPGRRPPPDRHLGGTVPGSPHPAKPDEPPPLAIETTKNRPPRLCDLLFDPDVLVFEPLWTVIPSSKAILPVLSTLFPKHPYLLDAAFDLTDALRETGYVRKPIVGRCGDNITIVKPDGTVLAERSGPFDQHDQIVQEYCPLPQFDGFYVQVCTFSAMGGYAGACLRCEHSPIIENMSDTLPLRVVSDEALRQKASPDPAAT